MAWRNQINVRLARRTGIQIRQRDGRLRVVRAPKRELTRPAFIFSSVRSGSTLLRLILNSHSDIYAPHELHLRHIRVEFAHVTAQHAMSMLDFDQEALTHMLWDRLLTEALRRSGKNQLVEKTPHLVLGWKEVAACWPDARFIFLLRHPAGIVDSWQRVRTQHTAEEVAMTVAKYLTAVRDARRALPGLTVRYEDLTTDPGRESRRLCEFLDLPYEPAMVQYGCQDHGELRFGLGDWNEKIRSGSVQPPRPVPAMELPPALSALATDLGY